MSEHTKEPWRYLNDAGKFMQADQWTVSYEGQAASASSAFIFAGETPVAAIVEEAFEYKSDAPLLKANARRIVACVNACAGIPTDVLEAMPSGQPALEQQRDKLLAAMEAIADGGARTTPRNEKCAHGQYSFTHCEQCFEDFARAVIAEVKGQS